MPKKRYMHLHQSNRIQAEAHPEGGFQGWKPPRLELKKQHNFVDITQFTTLRYIYFSLNNHSSCC